MLRSAILLTSILLASGGCVLDDCEFETSTAETTGGLFLADGESVGDTLTLAFVTTFDPDLSVVVPDAVLEDVGTSPDNVLEVLYDAESTIFGSDPLAQPLVTTTVGDTVYVYIAGSLDPILFACSPGESVLEVDVREILAPVAVQSVRSVRLEAQDLVPETVSLLRALEADRLVRLPISI